MRLVAPVAIALALSVFAGCLDATAFECVTDTQCSVGQTRGVCEITGFCSLPDFSCRSGRRYDRSAGSGFDGTCVAQDCLVRLSASDTHTCGVVNGRIRCWGDNARGQLGDGTTTDSDLPVLVNQLVEVGQVDTGGSFSCAIAGQNTAHCWGAGTAGQLGNTEFSDSRRPERVDSDDCGGSLIAVTAGDEHACGITAGRNVCCWGNNASGRLGINVGGFLSKARPVEGLPDAVEVSAGGGHTCAIDVDGILWCWGDNTAGQLGDGSLVSSARPVMVPLAQVREVSAGRNHTCALTRDDRLHCWGDDSDGQLGDSAAGDSSSSPVQLGLDLVAGVSAGARHTCARLADHTALCWGFGEDGQLGDGGVISTSSPAPVAGIGDAYDVVAGEIHSCVVRGDGSAACWGGNGSGELGAPGEVTFGIPSPTPVTVTLEGCGG